LFAFDGAAEVADMGDLDVSGLDGEDDLLGTPAAVVVEVEASVNSRYRERGFPEGP
jgi:hypothetical protein